LQVPQKAQQNTKPTYANEPQNNKMNEERKERAKNGASLMLGDILKAISDFCCNRTRIETIVMWLFNVQFRSFQTEPDFY
jgi:hypothetical protein